MLLDSEREEFAIFQIRQQRSFLDLHEVALLAAPQRSALLQETGYALAKIGSRSYARVLLDSRLDLPIQLL